MIKTHWNTFLLLSLFVLGGCGFHLKGYQHPLPQLDGLYVEEGERRNTLAGVIRRELSLSGTKLAATAEGSTYQLRITQEKSGRRATSFDANGKALGYELRLQASFLLLSNDGGVRLPEQSLELMRQLNFSGSDELGERNEEALQRADMRLDIADRIIRRLQAQLK